MFSREDDDDDFITVGSSNLASLFHTDKTGLEESNQSLMYSAPKQPKKPKPTNTAEQAQPAGRPRMNIIYADFVHTFKYDGSKHVSQGQLGFAIIGNHELASFKLLLYKGQQQHVAFATVSSTFLFTIQANNYVTFYDDTKQNWSINFKNEQKIIDFATQVCLAKAAVSSTDMKTIITQDLALGDGESLDAGDSVEIKYTGWFITDNKLGEKFDSNVGSEKSLRLKINHGKCIKGIEDGLIGMKKLGRRMVVIPPCLGYANMETANAKLKNHAGLLVYEMEVKKCRFSKDSASVRSATPVHTESDSEKKTNSPLKSRSSSLSDDSSVKARCASLSEQISQSPNKKKATIISRIVKMGQHMLPLQGAIAVQPSSESETEDDHSNPVSATEPVAATTEPVSKPMPKPRLQQPHIASAHAMPSVPMNSVANPGHVYASSQAVSHIPMMNNTLALMSDAQYSQPIPTPVVVGGGDAHISLLLAESRTQNMELRMHMSKLSEKLDSLASKVDFFPSGALSSVPSMDTTTLSFNIQRIFQENETLRKELAEKSTKIENQNDRISDLLHKNQKYVEQSTDLLQQRSNSLHGNTLQLQMQLEQKENAQMKLDNDLRVSQDQVALLQEKLNQSENRIKELIDENDATHQSWHQKISEAQSKEKEEREAAAFKWDLERRDLQEEIAKLESTVALSSSKKRIEESSQDQLEKIRNEYKDQIEIMETKLKELQHKLEFKENPGLINEVKKIMNAVYKHLQAEFEVEKNYQGSYINNQLKQKLRDLTLLLMQKYSAENEIGETKAKASSDANDTSQNFQESQSKPEDDKEISGTGHHHDSQDASPRKSETEPLKRDENGISAETEQEIYHEAPEKRIEDEYLDKTREAEHESFNQAWKPEPPPPPTFFPEEDEDDWLK